MELIQGLHIDVPGTEMKTLFEGRLRYHQEKVEKLQLQLASFKKLDKELADEAASIGKISNSSPAASIEQVIKKHADQVVYYSFMVAHVVIGATYRLNQGELFVLGIQADRF
jgi:hypothetical protein